MFNYYGLLRSVVVGFAVILTSSLGAAPPVVITAEQLPGTKARLGDAKPTYILANDVTTAVPIGSGRVRVRAFLRDNGKGAAYRSTPFVLSAGGESARMTVDALASGSPLAVTFVNRRNPAAVRIHQGELSAEVKKELLQLETAAGASTGPKTSAKASKNDDPLAELGLAAPTALDALASALPMVLVERLEVTRLSGPLLVAEVRSDRITYRPGDTATISVRLENLGGTAAKGMLSVDLVQGLTERTSLFAGEVEVPAGETITRSYAAPVGEALWGRGVEVRIESPEGSDVGTHAFSVVTNPWMVAITGRGLPQFGSERWSAEQAEQEAERIAQANMAAYANLYEAFAWAPCDFSQLTIADDATIHSGQTQYTRNRQALTTLHRIFHRHGIACITYGKSCAAGLPGVEYALRHPEQMNVFSKAGFAHEAISVDVLDRMLENRFRRHGRDEDFWQSWISSWTLMGNRVAAQFGCDEIVRSARQFAWDGVRYDGHFSVFRNPAMSARFVHECAERIQKQLPGFGIGYNYCGPQHNTLEGALADVELAACARGGGLIMSEYYRGLLGPVHVNIGHLRAVGDATRLHGGYFLCIADEASIWNQALVLASGARPMGGGGLFNKFATRFSEFILDPALRRLQDPGKVIQPRENADFRWDAFVYEKPVGPDRSWLILQLVNVTDKLTLRGQYQPPTGTSGPRENVSFKLALPAGYQAASALVCDDPVNFTMVNVPVTAGQFTVPRVETWTMAAVELKKDAKAKALEAVCEVPLNFAGQGGPSAEEARAALQLAPAVSPEVVGKVNEARIKVTPAVLDQILAQGSADDNDPAARAHLPADFAAHKSGVDAALAAKLPAAPALSLRRDGRPDVLLVRGVFSHWDRLEQATATLPNVRIHDAAFVNGRVGCSAALAADNVACLEGWPARDELACMDLVVLDDIPATAFSLAERRDLRDYVAAGGSLLVLGGWYSLSKGSWEGSFLEEVLPLDVVQTSHLLRLPSDSRTLRYLPDFATTIGPGAADFGTDAAVEWMNHVRVRPGAQVLMNAGAQPLLVAGQFGQGQALVWVGSHSGQPASPYWTNPAWPKLLSLLLTHWMKGAERPAMPAPEVAQQLAKAVQSLAGESFDQALDGPSQGADEKTKADRLNRLRFLLAKGSNREALAVATYLLENPGKVDPQHYNALIEGIVPKIQNDEGWSKLGQKHLGAPPLLCEGLVAEIAAVAVSSIRFSTIQSWKLTDPVMRLCCIAASADPAALGPLAAELQRLTDTEAKWASLQAADDYSTATVFDLYQTRLLRPFVAQAMMRCGRHDAQTLEQFCRGVLELPYYAWRQHWILDGARASLRDAQRQGLSTSDAKIKVRDHELAIRKLERAQKLLDGAFHPQVMGLDSAACQAAAHALMNVDSRKSLPLALRYVQEIPTDKLDQFSPIAEAALPELRQVYQQRLQERGGAAKVE